MGAGNGKSEERWFALGKEVGETKACALEVKDKLDKFMTNDHVHLCADVNALRAELGKLATRIAYIVGGIMAIEFALQIGVRLLAK